MADENDNVPRRLRRFLRKGEPIPEKLLPKTIPENEPWNQPAITARARSNIAVTSKMVETKTSDEAMRPKHRGARFQEMQQNSFSPQPPKAMDKALGLEKKSQLQERLPSSGNKAIEMKKDEIQKALEEIKRYKEPTEVHSADTLDQMAEHIVAQNKNSAQTKTESNASFHFTPIASAPNPVDAKKLSTSTSNNLGAAASTNSNPLNPSPISNDNLSPKERMELRRQQRGQPMASSAQGVATSSVQKQTTTTTTTSTNTAAASNMRSHIRRRTGQVDESASEAMTESSNPDSADAPLGKSDEDFKDLFDDDKPISGNPKKKKDKKPTDDEDFDSDEDMELLEDDEK